MTITELRQYRIGEYAAFDLVVSFLGMALIAPLLSFLFGKIGLQVPKKNWVALTLPVGILAHVLVGSYTPMTNHLLDPSSHYVLKAIILLSLVLGVWGVSRK